LGIWPQDLRPAVIADSVSLHRSDSILMKNFVISAPEMTA